MEHVETWLHLGISAKQIQQHEYTILMLGISEKQIMRANDVKEMIPVSQVPTNHH